MLVELSLYLVNCNQPQLYFQYFTAAQVMIVTDAINFFFNLLIICICNLILQMPPWGVQAIRVDDGISVTILQRNFFIGNSSFILLLCYLLVVSFLKFGMFLKEC